MPRYACAGAECTVHPIDRCFDCGAHFCDGHLTLIAMPTSGDALREYLCESCLQAHMAEPDRYGLVTVVENAAELAPGAPDVYPAVQA